MIPSLTARKAWIEQQVLEVSRECGVTLVEARASRSADQWDRDWLNYVAKQGDTREPVTVRRVIWNAVVKVCGSYSEACRWARLYGINPHMRPRDDA